MSAYVITVSAVGITWPECVIFSIKGREKTCLSNCFSHKPDEHILVDRGLAFRTLLWILMAAFILQRIFLDCSIIRPC
jgi:hypothetical protein